MFLIVFSIGHALPLVETRISCPRSVRGEAARLPRILNGSSPRRRPPHGPGLSTVRSRTRTFHVRDQSASPLNPRALACPRTIHVRGHSSAWSGRGRALSTVAIRPRIIRIREIVSSLICPRIRAMRGLDAAYENPRCGLIVTVSRFTDFRAQMLILLAYVLV
jgi:hypothetical protein